ncbi:MAG: YraN family protein [Chromatiales bacterium]|nr:YraN family protein [Chromatiales bacterium]
MMGVSGNTSRDQGELAEKQARKYLEQQGLRYVANNVRGRFGELDLIMRHGETLVFVEVRYRRSGRFGGALASVDRNKQRKLITTALGYLQQHPHDGPCRFDVVAIGEGADGIEWLQNAFELSE